MKTNIFKFLGFLLVLIVSNFVYQKTTYKDDLSSHSEILNLVTESVNQNSEIIYLGESSNTTFRVDDRDKRSISEMAADFFPNLKFGHLTKEASHARVYYNLLSNYPEKTSLKTVIVTMNVRSFNAGWIYSDLETGLQKQLVLMSSFPPIIKRFLLAFKAYDVKTNKERRQQYLDHWKNDYLEVPENFKYKNVIDWDKGMGAVGVKSDNGSYDYPATELACHYIKTFAFTIDSINNPRIKDFDLIVELAKERGWNLIFNIMAENTTQANNLVGSELLTVMKNNRDFLVKRYSSKGVLIVDNFELVRSDDYIDQKWTTEHYAERGRKIIARNLANQLKNIYAKEYVPPTSKPSKFFYDCEGESIWGNKNSLTKDQKFSGKFSSRVNSTYPFGIVLELKIGELPSEVSRAKLNFKFLQSSLDHDAKLVFQINGSQIEQHWKGVGINDLNFELNKWVNINYTYELPEVFFKGDVVKIYIHSISDQTVYVDDFEIEFVE